MTNPPSLFAPYFAAAVLTFLLMVPSLGAAQGLFSPALRVNDDVITNYELQQRARFLRLLNAPGDPGEAARTALIEDRLKKQEVSQFGIQPSPDDIAAGMEEFAQRGNMSREEFINTLEENGVSPQTFRDFTEAGLAWRDYVRGRFLGQARPSEDEIDQVIGRGGSAGGLRVLLSEIIIPVTPQTANQVAAEAQRISGLTGFATFSTEAERYSAAPSRERGGRLDWLTLNSLPPGIQSILLELAPGEITAPIGLDGAVALFQLRDIAESPTVPPRYSTIEYAAYYLPGGRTTESLAAARALVGRIDVCDDLYGVARGQPPEVLDRERLPPSEIPQDFAAELAKLDDNEVSTDLTRNNGQTLVFLMLCGRTQELGGDASRADIANALTQQRLNTLAETYLQQLRANAVIVEQ
ncbi:MAG: peptidylprolyl isomerase [Rhodobacteraceae bacterium]|nr:peptidylprolyl isomerase [Paracoccaceae bacterium]